MEIKKIECERCHKLFSIEYIDEHHPDKKNKPNDVMILCKDCHYREHNNVVPNTESNNIMADGYGILPNKVLFDSTISPSSKLLYVLISSLCAVRGYCFANNKYLADRLGISERQVTRLITELEKYLRFENRTDYSRRIYISDCNIDKNVHEHSKECLGNVDKNVVHNIKDNNKNNILGPSPSAPASDIQYVPLEDEIKSLRKKEVKSDPELTVKRDIIGFFIRKSKEYHNDYCPVINLPAALRLVNGCLDFSNPTEIKEWIEWYLQSDLYEILGSDIKTCLCTASYNKYKDHRRKYD